ncbi:hypothetical protein KQX54_019014 [Cotesia glomerata]|uniref:Uncharacterized protein n=1 Tax=Cotesia glomerata TaxID=32391 RepID=A0AAV7HT47_COTGL|nr:hypothetical protein KQX54_019014 [Cotesia glomerata]
MAELFQPFARDFNAGIFSPGVEPRIDEKVPRLMISWWLNSCKLSTSCHISSAQSEHQHLAPRCVQPLCRDLRHCSHPHFASHRLPKNPVLKTRGISEKMAAPKAGLGWLGRWVGKWVVGESSRWEKGVLCLQATFETSVHPLSLKFIPPPFVGSSSFCFHVLKLVVIFETIFMLLLLLLQGFIFEVLEEGREGKDYGVVIEFRQTCKLADYEWDGVDLPSGIEPRGVAHANGKCFSVSSLSDSARISLLEDVPQALGVGATGWLRRVKRGVKEAGSKEARESSF